MAINKDPKSTKGNKFFWKKAGEVLPKKNCGDFNQGLMELGATLCRPTNPQCPLCPLKNNCAALRQGNPESYPHTERRVIYRQVQMTAAVIENHGRLLLRQRPDHGLLKGMWEFPMVEGDLEKLLQEFRFRSTQKLPPLRHSILDRRLIVTPYRGTATGGRIPKRYKWFNRFEINKLASSSLNHKILQGL